MNTAQVAGLLTVVASFDRRTLGEADVLAWHSALYDLDFEDCRCAVATHFAHETAWLMPAHIRKIVKASRQDTAMRALPVDSGEKVTMPAWFKDAAAYYREQAKVRNAARAAGEPVPDVVDLEPSW